MTLSDDIELVLWRLLPLAGTKPEVVQRAAEVIHMIAYQKLVKEKVDDQK